MRIAYLTGSYPKASHTFIQREISALRKHGAIISVAAIRKPEEKELTGIEERTAASETFYVIKSAKNFLFPIWCHIVIFFFSPYRWLSTLWLAIRTARTGVKGFIWQIFYFVEAGVVAEWIRRNKSEHLHNHFGDASASVAMFASRLASVPFSFTLHGPTEFFEAEAWRLDEKTSRASFVACISYFARSQAMIFSNPDEWHKLRIVHCGVDASQYHRVSERVTKEINLLFVGRITQLKGIRILLDALRIVRTAYPDIELKIIGDGPDRPWVESAAKEIGGIELLGYRSQAEVSEALAISDALVLPSFAEGLPVVFMEALASECPVIATRVGGVQELVLEGNTGILVAPGDVDGLAAAISTLIASPELHRKMARAGKKKVEEEFNIDCEAAWLLELFKGEDDGALRPKLRSAPAIPPRLGTKHRQSYSNGY